MKIQEKIDLYVRGKLDQDEIDSLWVELAKEPELLEQLKTEYALHELLNEKDSNAKVHRLPNRVWYGAAAAAVVLLMILPFLMDGRKTYPFNTINLNENQIESSSSYRSQEDLRRVDSLLVMSGKAIVDLDFEPAQEYINQIDAETDSLAFAKAQINQGLIHYIKGDYKKATDTFNKALLYTNEQQRPREKIYWFLANISFRTDKPEEARSFAEQTITYGGLYKDDAKRMLQYLDEQQAAED